MRLGIPKRRTFFLPNIIDTTMFSPGAVEPTDIIRLVAVGRLWKEKRFDRFIELMARVRERSRFPVKGIIVGSGRGDEGLRPQLQAQAARLGLRPADLEFKGAVSDMAAIYRAADILVLTSDHEGTPNVILEAMASGLPVVATNVGGVPGIIQHGRTGYLVGKDAMDDMVDHTLRLINDREHRLGLGKQARTYIEINHALNRLPVFLAALYEQALGRRLNPEPVPSIALAEGQS
jgi:glycosyltransferase involved in cell wall biosynthesis